MKSITYRLGNDLDLDQVIELYIASTLGARRPVGNRGVMESMLQHSNLVVSAWAGDLMVGISRSLTDFAYVCYLSDLAVRESFQHQGIGRELIRQTQAALGSLCKIVLLAAPAAVEYYPKLGFDPHPSAWVLATDRLL